MKPVCYLLMGLLTGAVAARAQAPVLTTCSPVRNAVDVPAYAPVVLTFSQPMSAGTASGAAIKVFSRQHGGLLTRPGGGGLFSGGGTATIRFEPDRPFLPGEELTVVATPAARSGAGVALAAPQVYQFTARAGRGPKVFVADSLLPVGGSPFTVKMADVDGDGDVDLLTANPFASTVSVRLNDGRAHFSGGSDVPGTNGAMYLEMADADGDGDLDLFTANYGPYPPGDGNQVAVFANDGRGTFTPLTQVTVLPGVYTMTLADVNGDGAIDIVAPSNKHPTTPGPQVAVRLNDGTGHFTAAPNLTAPYGIIAVAAGDVDNDGAIDLFTPSDQDTLATVWHNDGTGSFTPSADLRITYGWRAMLTDIDADGDLDVLHANQFDGFSIMRNDGRGHFGPATRVPMPGVQLNNLIAPDLDGDGDLDVVVTNLNQGTVSVFTNNGTGTFTGPAVQRVGAFDYIVTAADVDGDLDLDLITTVFNDNAVRVLLNGGTSVGLPEAAATARLSLFPNPATGTVRLSGAPAGPVMLLDALGRTVRTYPLEPDTSDRELDLSGLPSGLYTVRAGAVARRLVVE